MTARLRLAAGIAGFLAATLCVVAHAQPKQARSPPASSSSDLQLTYQVDRYAELASHGVARGETLYFYKCFVCHNHYAKGGPALSGLFRRNRLSNGKPLDKDSVTALIQSGGDDMPGFRYDLSAGDISDILGYLRSTDCCYEAESPPVNPGYRAAIRKWPVPHALRGGAHGKVRERAGNALGGIGIQLIEPNGVRITVFTDAGGNYEFPAMKSGTYLLRVATPLPYESYQRDRIWVEGNDRLDDIVLTRVSQPRGAGGSLPGVIPGNAESASQLSGAELLWNLPGSLQEKVAFVKTCGIGCHDLKEVLRNRFDENGWRSVAAWMTSPGSGSIFVVRPHTTTLSLDAERVVAWLSRVRGPIRGDKPYRPFPRAASSADVVVTEYELPREFLSVHDVAGDSKGNMWYSSHRTPYVGMLDPRTGIVTEYKVPDIPGAFPGTYKVAVDRSDTVWFSQNWAHRLARLVPATGRFRQVLADSSAPVNVPTSWGDFALAPDGSVWSADDQHSIVRMDADTGAILSRYRLTRNPTPEYGILSGDGRFWAGSALTMGGNTGELLDIGTGTLYEVNSGSVPSSGARGGFDKNDNAWFGGHMGSIVEMVNEIDRGKGVEMRVFTPPMTYFPYTQFYSAVPDKNENVWTAWLNGPGFVRFNAISHDWRIYDMPEPSAFTRDTWVDDSTNPATIWYADYSLGVVVRIQPRS